MSVDQRLDEEKSVILGSCTYLQGDFNITGGSRQDQNSAHRLIKAGLEELSASSLSQSGVIGTFNPPLSQVTFFCYWTAPVMVLIKVKV